MTHVEFISFLFELEVNSHIAHLKAQSQSYGEHIALDEVYNNVKEFRDEYAEILQAEEILSGYPQIQVRESVPPVILIKNAITSCKRYRSTLVESHLQNEIDTLTSSLSKSLYKLKNLK